MAFFTWAGLYRVSKAVIDDEPSNDLERDYMEKTYALFVGRYYFTPGEIRELTRSITKLQLEFEADAWREFHWRLSQLYIVENEQNPPDEPSVIKTQAAIDAVNDPIDVVNYYLREIAIEIVAYTLRFLGLPDELAQTLGAKIADGIQQTLYRLLFGRQTQIVVLKRDKKAKASGGSH